jgi:hypothetical protein
VVFAPLAYRSVHRGLRSRASLQLPPLVCTPRDGVNMDALRSVDERDSSCLQRLRALAFTPFRAVATDGGPGAVASTSGQKGICRHGWLAGCGPSSRALGRH